jgi:hypothetical protein
MLRAALAAAIALAVFGPALAAEPSARCGVLLRDGGEIRSESLPGFSVSDAALPLQLPEGLGDVQGVMCSRESLHLLDNDYCVITDLGVPFYLASGGRLIVLEISSGQFRARTAQGELTKEELDRLQAALNAAQSRIQGEAQ